MDKKIKEQLMPVLEEHIRSYHEWRNKGYPADYYRAVEEMSNPSLSIEKLESFLGKE